MKTKPKKTKQTPRQSATAAQARAVTLARANLATAKREALKSKAVVKRTKKALKTAKHEARAARKRVKELKRVLREVLREPTRTVGTATKKTRTGKVGRPAVATTPISPQVRAARAVAAQSADPLVGDKLHKSGAETGAAPATATARKV